MDISSMINLVIGSVVLLAVIKIIFWILNLRRVVSTNEVHIVQSRASTKSYGKDTENGNTYYEFPVWLPKLGITKIVLPVSVFDIDLIDYEAYDKGRLPFVVDVKSFFRIDDSNLAAQRVSSFESLKEQLVAIVQGAVRTILASNDIETIMQGRSEFGSQFTTEVQGQLKNWGVTPVKNIELMDIRDSSKSNVIHNIMEKKKSLIEMESRKEVAENLKLAQIAEIDAKRQTDIQEQEALQRVGERKAEADRLIGLANQKTSQEIALQAKITKEHEMEVIKVAETKAAEIAKQVSVVKAEQEKQTMVIMSEGDKQKAILAAEALLETKQRESAGIRLEGDARAEAEKAMQMAPVSAQIALAKEIGENDGYQHYLISKEQVAANKEVGLEQAKALASAELKVIAQAGDATTGISKLSDALSVKGGVALAGAIEGFMQTDTGKAIIGKVVNPDRTDK